MPPPHIDLRRVFAAILRALRRAAKKACARLFALDYGRRQDRSLGWAALESKQSAAFARAGLDIGPAGEPGSEPQQESPGLVAPGKKLRPTILGILKLVLAWAIALQLCYLLATAILISAYRRIDPPATVLIAYREWRFGWKVQAPKPVSLRKIPAYIRSMLIAVEDGKFYVHHGLDFEAFARAREINARVGKPLYGGSTLTMQVARTLFLVPEKSYIRKYLEVLTALELEALLPKDRILELYFGYAEWGKGLFGIESASRRWYGRDVSSITRDEAARLIALLSSPIKYGPETLQKNGILRDRYRYLVGRFVHPEPEPAEGASPPPPSVEPGSDAAAEPDPAAPSAEFHG
jgi:monofunctional glycosyltransferase